MASPEQSNKNKPRSIFDSGKETKDSDHSILAEPYDLRNRNSKAEC